MPPPSLATQSVSDSYFLLLEKLDSMALAQSRLQEAYYIDASHFAVAQRLNEMHFFRIQHLRYDIPQH